LPGRAAFEQPVREIRAGPQLGDRQVQCAGAGVEAALPIAVAGVGALGTALAVAGPAQGVGFGAHQGVDEQGEHLAQHVRAGGGESVGQHSGQVDIVNSGHRVIPLLE
jgi:hypothetical protein